MIQAYSYSQGSVKEISIDSIKDAGVETIWIDITNIDKQEENLVRELFRLHPLTSEDLYNSNVRIKIEEFSDYLFSVFYGVKNLRSMELIELDFILGKNFLITNHKMKIESFERVKSNPEKLAKLFHRGVDFLFHKLIDEEIDNFFPALEKLDEVIDEVEQNIGKKEDKEIITGILDIKKNVSALKKIAMPQREKMGFLAKNEYDMISKKAIPYFRDVYDHSVKVVDLVESYRDSISNVYDIYMSTLSNNMNEVMKVLSIIATIAMPLTVISGIYGTNFTSLPGAGYRPGFWIMIMVMILLCMGMLIFFKKKRWF